MTSSPVLLSESHGAVRILTLNRPEALNAFDDQLYADLTAALATSASDDSVHCVVLTGTPPAFSAGADLHGLKALATGDDGRVNPAYDALLRELEAFPKPIIAAVNGLAIGIGMTLLGHMDVVFAGRSARFRAPFGLLGLGPEGGSTSTFLRLLGRQRTAALLFSGGWMDAQEAVAGGLVLDVADDTALMADTLSFAQEVAAMPLPSLMATKQLILEVCAAEAQSARAREDQVFCQLASTAAAHERILTALERSA